MYPTNLCVYTTTQQRPRPLNRCPQPPYIGPQTTYTGLKQTVKPPYRDSQPTDTGSHRPTDVSKQLINVPNPFIEVYNNPIVIV